MPAPRRALASGLLAVLAGGAAAVPAIVAGPTEADVPASGSRRAIIAVEVTSKDGGPVPGLSAGDFRVRAGGRRARVVEVEAASPLSAVLLLEVSRPVFPVQDELRRGAEAFVRSLGPEDETAIMVFARSPAVLFPFSTDHVERRRKILSWNFQAVSAEGSRVADALMRAVLEAAQRSGRRVVIVFTTVRDTGSSTSMRAVQETAQRQGVRVDILHVPRPAEWPRGYWRQILAPLQRLARETGGGSWAVREADAIAPRLAASAGHLQAEYRLLLEIPGERPASGERLRVRVSRKGVSVRAPTFVY